MPPFRKHTLAIALAVAALANDPVRACGPDFPNAYLAEGSVSLLSAPEGYFASEIAKLAPAKTHACDTDSNEALLIAANKAKRDDELTETGVLRIELAKRGCTKERIDALAAELEAARAAIFAKAWDKPPHFSDDMPAECALYLKGAFAYWKNNYETAGRHWEALLALPADQRRHYTVNAAYMLGRMCVPDEPRHGLPSRNVFEEDTRRDMLEGTKWFQHAREAAAAGFDDLSSLAHASLGWEARAWFFSGDDAKAIHLYLQQCADSGDSSAVLSLRAVARAALEHTGHEGEQDASDIASLRSLARDELSRRVVTLYLLARFGAYAWPDGESEKSIARQSRAWAEILSEAKLNDVPDADRLAWLAYQAGFYELAAKWLESASENSVPANWIRAKLALRAGDTQRAEHLLQKVTGSPELLGEAYPVAWADLGRVRMGLGEYVSALDAFMHGGHWEDSAYIAERVLTLDELEKYIELHEFGKETLAKYPQRELAGEEKENAEQLEQLQASLRHLLARRLARASRPDEAKKYFPEEYRCNYAAYVADVREGFDLTLPAEKRADAFWRAARLIHENGMEILGTELAPDYFIWGGSFQWSPIAGARQGELKLSGGPGAPTANEINRLETTTPPEKRFHYRYRAAELGWWAASLLPNGSEQTALMLNTAGGWIKNRDPKEANRFYQALVIRCGNTALGKAAAARNWFPDSVSDSSGKEVSESAEAEPAQTPCAACAPQDACLTRP